MQIRSLILAFSLTACGGAPAPDFSPKKGVVASYGVESCKVFRCGNVEYTLPEFPSHRCHWQCAEHNGNMEQVLVEFHEEQGCYVPPRVTTSPCWEP